MTQRLYRSTDRIIGGVCGGIADYFNLDVSLVRIAYVLLSVMSIGFPGILFYLIAWIVIPPRA